MAASALRINTLSDSIELDVRSLGLAEPALQDLTRETEDQSNSTRHLPATATTDDGHHHP